MIFLLLICLKRVFSVEKYAESCEEECISWAIVCVELNNEIAF